VTGGNLSEILGDLQSNGRVFLINSNGLIVGDDAVIDAAGFVGSTLDISNQAFSSGDFVANGGSAALVGGHVSTSGSVELVESADGRIFLESTDLTTVRGNLNAGGADIHIEGRQVEIHGATVETGGAGLGGDISLLGDNVAIFADSNIEATGEGGGTILIGGERQGRGETRRAEFVYLDSDASVSADGGVSGDGGTVILFAEDSARIRGQVTARGGIESGDGGFIETSGLAGLEIISTPNAGADNGEDGIWLIDPFDITVVPGSGVIDVDETAPPFLTSLASGATVGAT